MFLFRILVHITKTINKLMNRKCIIVVQKFTIEYTLQFSYIFLLYLVLYCSTCNLYIIKEYALMCPCTNVYIVLPN